MRYAEYILLIPLLLAGCHSKEALPPSPPPQSNIDSSLRTFMGIHTLAGAFTLPETAQGYYPVVVMFADGKEVARAKLPLVGYTKHQTTAFSGEMELLWPADFKLCQRAVFTEGLNQDDLTALYPYWHEFGSSSGWGSCGENCRYQGIWVRGILGASPEIHQSPSFPPVDVPTFAKYVVAIGVVYGDDYDSIRADFLKSNPASP